jgi:RNA polymerase sigma-70 factor (ECF subfamily)
VCNLALPVLVLLDDAVRKPMGDDPLDATEAVRAAYQAYYRRLVGQVFALTADLAEAQDVVQEAFARTLARPGSFLASDDPERWLRVTALNLARTRFRRRVLFTRLVRTGRIEPAAESVPGLSPDRLALLAALRQLGRPTREAVVLHHLADLPVEEVAATLTVPIGTVKARLVRGRRALAKLLSEGEPDGVAPIQLEEAKHA